jgi:hypothetical protein
LTVTFLIACLGDVHRVPLDLVAVLVAVVAVGVVGRLDGLGAHLFLLEREDDLFPADGVLLLEDRFKGPVLSIVMLLEEVDKQVH